MATLDLSPIPFTGWDSTPRGVGFLLRRVAPSTVPFVFGLDLLSTGFAFPQALR